MRTFFYDTLTIQTFFYYLSCIIITIIYNYSLFYREDVVGTTTDITVTAHLKYTFHITDTTDLQPAITNESDTAPGTADTNIIILPHQLNFDLDNPT